MQRLVIAAVLVLAALTFFGCSSSPHRVDAAAEPAPPERTAGEVAVFGKVRVVEDIMGTFEVEDQDNAMYVNNEAADKSYRVKCASDGSFGVYLPPGVYTVKLVNADDYRFIPFARFTVPDKADTIYVGTLELDGSPTGVYKGDYSWFADTYFTYSIKDESAELFNALRKVSPGSESRITVKLMESVDYIAIGSYDEKVLRSDDIVDGMAARKNAVEHVVGGVIRSLPYVINPIWILTLH